MDKFIDDMISEKVRAECAKEQLRLEKILTFKFQELVENKMAHLEIKTETKLLSKYEKNFNDLEEKLHKQMKSSEDFHRHLVTKQDFLKLKDEFNNFKKHLRKDLHMQCENFKKQLKESTKNVIEGVLQEKCEEIERKSVGNLETKCQNYSEDIKNDLSHNVEMKLRDKVESLKDDLKKDFLAQNEDLKNNMEETSKGFIEGIIKIKCEEIEMKSFNNLKIECKKFSEDIKNDLSHDFECKLKQNVEHERTILLNEIKSNDNFKGNVMQVSAIQQLKEELTKHVENEKCNLERSLTIKYESEILKMKEDLKHAISSEIHCDINSLSKKLDVISPSSLNIIWEIKDFKSKFSNKLQSIESEVFHLHEIGCQIKFIFHLHTMFFEVKYVNQPTDEAFPLNGHHRITFILNDQVGIQPQNDFIAIFEPTFHEWTDRTLLWFKPTREQVTFLHSRWRKSGKVQVKVMLEHLSCIIALEPRHYGHVIWKIDNFNDVCKSCKYGRQYSSSETFYLSEQSYRMKGALFFDDRVYFRLYFLKGPWDKDLPKTFKHRTTIVLISQEDQSELKDILVSVESDSSSCDIINKFTRADLEKYAKNDSLIIDLKVEAL